MSDAPRVAVYGLGNMGYLIARRIAARMPVWVRDLDQGAMERARREFAGQPLGDETVLGACGIVVLCLPSPAASFAVLRAIAPLLPAHCVVVETSTVNPRDMREEQRILQPHGIAVVDASVLAGVSQMAAGTASLLLGGAPEALAAARPVLDAIAEKQINFGELGAGAAAKVINNAVAHAVMVVVTEAGSLATAAGVDCDKLIGLLSDPQMGLHRPLTYRYAQRVVGDDYEGGMPLDAARKDSVLALELAQALDVPLFAIQASHSVYEIAARAGYGRDDYAAIAKIWADWGKPAAQVKTA